MRFGFAVAVALALFAASSGFGAQVRVTGTFTDLRYSQESGDLIGVELLIVPAHGDTGSYVAFVQMAEGGAPYSAVVPVEVSGNKLKFSMPNPGTYAGLSFSGIVSRDRLIGTWTDGNHEVLRRHASYWD
jgi:hypothetical protein